LTMDSTESDLGNASIPVSEQKAELPLPKREKIKTRKKGHKTDLDSSIDREEMRKEVRLETIEELLKSSPTALEIFYRLFSNYERQHIRVNAIDISMTEIELLMNALHQEFNSSKGKGSHTKITLYREGLQPHCETSSQEAMIILSNKTKLNGAQIANIRDRFLEFQLFPAHLKNVLIEKKVLFPIF
jgi:hypothetical protein